jgi:GMP synthase-like glutamine amidotransferase
VRIIGVCFGHQILGRAFGNKVGRNEKGWELAVCDVDLSEKGKELFQLDTLVCFSNLTHLAIFDQPSITSQSIIRDANIYDSIRSQKIQQMHQDIVYTCPPNVTPLGSSPNCELQGFYSQGRFITIQGHPEFTEHLVTEILESRAQLGIFTEEQAGEALTRVGNHHDGVAVGAAFLRFLLED